MNHIFILSKDRAAQLDSLLRQVREYVTGYNKIYIQYTFSSELHERSYELLKEKHADLPIEWIYEEGQFAFYYKYILDEMGDEDYVFLLCDDDVIYRPIDIDFCSKFLDDHIHFNTRLGKNIIYNRCALKEEKLPDSATLLQDEVYSWNWTNEEATVDYKYPLPVNTVVYNVSVYRNLIYMIIGQNTTNANWLEGYLQNLLNVRELYDNEYFTRMCCYRESHAFCSWLNAVQSMPRQDFDTYLNPEEAVIQFLSGKELHFICDNIIGSCQGCEYTWI